MWIIRSLQFRQCPLILFCFLLTFLTVTETASSQNRELSERGKAADLDEDDFPEYDIYTNLSCLKCETFVEVYHKRETKE